MTNRAPICWPRRFLAVWLAFCLAGFVAGGLLALARRPVAQDVQARVIVRAAGRQVAAYVYPEARTQGEMKPGDRFKTGARGEASKRLLGGHYHDFMVQVLDDRGDPAGPPVAVRALWPARPGELVTLEAK